MNQENKLSVALTPEQQKDIQDKIAALQTALKPLMLVNLTSEERMNMLKMSDKTYSFVAKAFIFAEQNPALVPNYMDLAEARRDFDLVSAIRPVVEALATMHRGLEDTAMMAGSEAYDGALIFYNSVKGAGRTNQSGAQAVYDELSKQFPRRSKVVK